VHPIIDRTSLVMAVVGCSLQEADGAEIIAEATRTFEFAAELARASGLRGPGFASISAGVEYLPETKVSLEIL
jgi:hypothetical protein